MLRFIPILFFYISALIYNAWGACYTVDIYLSSYSGFTDDSQGSASCNNPIACYSGSCEEIKNYSGYYYSGLSVVQGSCNYNGCVTSACGSRTCYTILFNCKYSIRCDTEEEAQQSQCELNGGYWNGTDCIDCGEETCITTTEHTAVNTNNTSSITCIGSNCSANFNCKVFSSLVQKCGNACGDSTTRIISTDTTYYDDSACDPERYFTDCSAETFCYELSSNYVLYKKCLSGQVYNGTESQTTKIIASGAGKCSEQGYLSTDPNQNNPVDSLLNNGGYQDSISNNCLIFGIGCPSDSSSVNYDSLENRTPQNGCICEPYDGLSYMSLITCPDGSQTVYYGSCDSWNPPTPSSSSADSLSSSSSATAGSSGSDSQVGDWANYSQMREQLELMGNQNYKLDEIKQGLNNINNSVQGIGTELDEFGNLDVSLPADPVIDSSEMVETGIKDTISKILSDFIPTENKIIDTSSIASVSGCPVITLTKAVPSMGVKETKIELGNLNGFNLCEISRTFLILLAEITSFCLVAGIFIKFSGFIV